MKIIPWDQSSGVHIDDIYTQLSWFADDRKPSGVTQERLHPVSKLPHPPPCIGCRVVEEGVLLRCNSSSRRRNWARRKNLLFTSAIFDFRALFHDVTRWGWVKQSRIWKTELQTQSHKVKVSATLLRVYGNQAFFFFVSVFRSFVLSFFLSIVQFPFLFLPLYLLLSLSLCTLFQIKV